MARAHVRMRKGERGGETGKGGGIYDGGRLFRVSRILVQLCRLLVQDGGQEGHF